MKTHVSKLTLLFAIYVISGCSSAPYVGQQNIGREIVVTSMNGETLPSWAKKASERSLYEEDGNIVSVSLSTLPGDSRIDAGFKIGELNAKAGLAKTLETRIESFTQLADEGTDFDGQQLRTLTTEAAKITASNMRPGRRFYQKVAVTDDAGTPKTEYRFWTEVTLSKEEFHKAMINAARRSSGKPTLSEAFAKQVDKNFEQLVGNADSTTNRKPSSQDDE